MVREIRAVLSAGIKIVALCLMSTGYAADPEVMVYQQVQQYVDEPMASEITDDILDACVVYEVDPVLAAAVFTVESGFQQDVVSHAGAVGIAQLMPDTAAMLGVEPGDVRSNIFGGVAYLGMMMDRYAAWDNPYVYAEAAYNAGPGAVDHAGGVPMYAETMHYVDNVEAVRADIWRTFGDSDEGRPYQPPVEPADVTPKKSAVPVRFDENIPTGSITFYKK